MNKNFTLKRALLSCALSGLVLFSGFNANSQCTNSSSACNPSFTANLKDFSSGANGFSAMQEFKL